VRADERSRRVCGRRCPRQDLVRFLSRRRSFSFHREGTYSTNTNPATAKLLKKPHINCCSHLLNNEVENWFERTTNIGVGKVAREVHTVMSAVKVSNKNSAVLRKETKLRPLLENKTKWTGRMKMMKNFISMREALIKSSKHENAAIDISNVCSSRFLNEATCLDKMLYDVLLATKTLQEKLIKLSDCREVLDCLIEVANDGEDDPNSHWYESGFQDKYIASDSKKIHNPMFYNGVIKIQNGKQQLTAEEKAACQCLLKEGADLAATSSAKLSVAEKLAARKAKKPRVASEYVNSDFIIGSVAEAERLWSEARHVLTAIRSVMAPATFEEIMLLKKNPTVWNGKLTARAYNIIKDERKVKREKGIKKSK